MCGSLVTPESASLVVMLSSARRPRILTRRPFRGSDAVARGLLTVDQLRTKGWRRLFRDVYVDARKKVDHDLLIGAAALVLPAGAAISGRSAAHFWGARLASPDDPVEVLTPPEQPFGPLPGLTIRTGPLSLDEIVRGDGVPITTPWRTAWELARQLEFVEAVAWLDALAGCRGIGRPELLAYAETRKRQLGWRRVTRAFDLVEPRAESPQESRLRMYLLLGGLPRPVVQYEILHNGCLLARADLAWPGARRMAEYDSGWQGGRSGPGQCTRDHRRWRAVRDAGWQICLVTGVDLGDPPALVAKVRDLLSSAA